MASCQQSILLKLTTLDAQGTLGLPGDSFTWAAGWDTILPGQFGGAEGRTDLLLYDADTGNAEVIRADGMGTLSVPGIPQSFPGQWDHVVSGIFDGDSSRTDLFFYEAERGASAFYGMNDQGEFQELGSPGDLAGGWDQIVPGYFGNP